MADLAALAKLAELVMLLDVGDVALAVADLGVARRVLGP